MTFAEKARKEHPELCDQELGYPTHCCPHHGSFGYEEYPGKSKRSELSCRECWNREIPEESEHGRWHEYEELGTELYAMKTAFTKSGFTEEQALDLVKQLYYTATQKLKRKR